MGIFTKCFGFSDSNQASSSATVEDLCPRFSLSQLRKSTNNFDQSRIIGRYISDKALYKASITVKGGTDFTATVSPQRYFDVIGFRNQVLLLCQLRHPNLMSLLGFCDEKGKLFLVYESVPDGSLYDHLHPGRRFKDREPISWKKRLEICIGTARGLHYLHTGAKHSIFHCDVDSTNILLDENLVPKLSGLAFSIKGPSFMSKPEPIEVSSGNNIAYNALEYYESRNFTEKYDVLSFGLVLLEVVCAKERDRIMNLDDEIFDFVRNGNGEEVIDPYLKGKIAPECWRTFMSIAQRCVLKEVTERPVMGEVEVELEHALALQEEADNANNNGDYSLSSINSFLLHRWQCEDHPIQHITEIQTRLLVEKVLLGCNLLKSVC